MKTNVQSPSNPFFTNVEKRFDIFKTKICKMAQKAKIGFDEDIFMDTLVKCMHTFSNPNPTDDDVDRYFWSAYKRNSYNSITRDRIRNRVDIDTLPEAIDEGDYNENIDNIVSIIEEEVRTREDSVDIDAASTSTITSAISTVGRSCSMVGMTESKPLATTSILEAYRRPKPPRK